MTTNKYIAAVQAQGWIYSPWYEHGGWVHPDVRDDDGNLRVYDCTAAQLAHKYEIEVET